MNQAYWLQDVAEIDLKQQRGQQRYVYQGTVIAEQFRIPKLTFPNLIRFKNELAKRNHPYLESIAVEQARKYKNKQLNS